MALCSVRTRTLKVIKLNINLLKKMRGMFSVILFELKLCLPEFQPIKLRPDSEYTNA